MVFGYFPFLLRNLQSIIKINDPNEKSIPTLKNYPFLFTFSLIIQKIEPVNHYPKEIHRDFGRYNHQP